jgi:hypothetical protein
VGALAYDAAADRLWIGGDGGIDRVDGVGRRWATPPAGATTIGGEP